LSDDDMMDDIGEEEVKRGSEDRMILKNVVSQECGASRLINANRVRKVPPHTPMCQSAITLIKGVIG
jgi:hypothetical protein